MTRKDIYISIIIPLYNREILIRDTLTSILNQSGPNWECIVIDDGSTDNSYDTAKEFTEYDSRIKVFQRPESYKPGGNGARNFGLSKASGSHICYFDSDDLLDQNFILQIAKTIEANISAPGFICDLNRFDNKAQQVVKHIKYNYNQNLLQNQITEKNKIYFQNTVLEKNIAKNNPLDEDLANSQDYVFFSEILMNHSPVIIPETLVNIRLHSNNISGNKHATKYVRNQVKATAIIYQQVIASGNIDPRVLSHLYFRNIVDLRKALLNKSSDLYYEIRDTIYRDYFAFLKPRFPVKAIFSIENCIIKLFARRFSIAPKTWYKVSSLFYPIFLRNK